jgi:hypothetical protein
VRADVIGFVHRSSNSKTGPIPVSVSRKITCPSTCPLKKAGCYARAGFLKFPWGRLEDGTWGMPWEEFLQHVRELPAGTFWRHAQAGDLPGVGTVIDRKKLLQLAEANRGRRGYAYTHKPPTRSNLSAVREACRDGFIVNLSADGPSMADKLAQSGLPVVTLVPKGTPAVSRMPEGRKIVVCPSQRRKGITCVTCKLCANGDRKFIIGFLPHGSQANVVHKVACEN